MEIAKTAVKYCVSVTGTVLASLVLVCTAAAATSGEAPDHALILGGGGSVGEA